MRIDVKTLSDDLASNPRLTDYDYWRALKIIDDEIFQIERNRAPIPMEIIHLRAILSRARAKLATGAAAAAGPRVTP